MLEEVVVMVVVSAVIDGVFVGGGGCGCLWLLLSLTVFCLL